MRGGLRCLDGSSLAVVPVPARDRGGARYEVTLELRRDGAAFGAVGERCGHLLAGAAARVAAARADGSPQARRWPDADDRFPGPDGVPGRDAELFALRCRERADVGHTDAPPGELRCTLRTSAHWIPMPGGTGAVRGRWRLTRRAVLEAWGTDGHGVRAVLTSSELLRFLTDLTREIRSLP
ncbi:hypothetical protein BTM25_37530 [Actinomadura rubteroloni]|uniref:Uncharacterized protein n=1 Tax=Actinomadura rubteroloni TaxID=1926885 RepID=A0A2P4UJB0_9ACTN|nr:hypothetical protein [Actinomadura rubteroloni]POM25111.1 hypothetical protein BTM25_37530 [Actinomadura rubteroloni]